MNKTTEWIVTFAAVAIGLTLVLLICFAVTGCSYNTIDLTPDEDADTTDNVVSDTDTNSETDAYTFQDSPTLDDAPTTESDSQPDIEPDIEPEAEPDTPAEADVVDVEAEDDAGAFDSPPDSGLPDTLPPDTLPDEDVQLEDVVETEDEYVPEDVPDFTETPDAPDDFSDDGMDSETEDSIGDYSETEDTEPEDGPTDPHVYVCSSWDGSGTSIEPFVSSDWLWIGTRDPQRGVGIVQITDRSALFRSGRDDWTHTSTTFTVAIPGGGTGPRQAWYVGGLWFFQQGSNRYVNETDTGITWRPSVPVFVEDETSCDPLTRTGWREGRADGAVVYHQEWTPCSYTEWDAISVNQGYACELDSTLPAYTPVRPLVTGPVTVYDFCFVGTTR